MFITCNYTIVNTGCKYYLYLKNQNSNLLLQIKIVKKVIVAVTNN